MKILKFLLVFSMVSFSSCREDTKDEAYYINYSFQRISEASIWILEEGVRVYKSEGVKAIRRKLMDDWFVQLWVTPVVDNMRDDGRYLAYFRLRTGSGLYFDIQCLHRKEGLTVNEYWMIRRQYADGVGLENSCSFFITTADSLDSSRKILFESDQFFEKYEFDDGNSIELPLDDNRLLYDLWAWEIPDSYRDSELREIEIIIVDGEYVRRRLGSR